MIDSTETPGSVEEYQMSRHHTERRASPRYPIERKIVFRRPGRRAGHADAVGQTINMSSSGLLFTADQPLSPGERIQMAVSWPVRLDQRWPMKMVLAGRVVRCAEGTAAVQILKYEFKTTGPNGLAI
jgi:hypothetical protein